MKTTESTHTLQNCEPQQEALTACLLMQAIHNYPSRSRKELSPYALAKFATQLHKAARTLHRINERQCNGYAHPRLAGVYFEKQEKRDEVMEERLRGAISHIIEDELKLVVRFQGDPRGWPVVVEEPNRHKTPCFDAREICRIG